MRTATARPLPLAPATKRAVWASAITMLFVALVAATPRSPFHSVLPREFEPGGPFRVVSDLLGLQHLAKIVEQHGQEAHQARFQLRLRRRPLAARLRQPFESSGERRGGEQRRERRQYARHRLPV